MGRNQFIWEDKTVGVFWIVWGVGLKCGFVESLGCGFGVQF